MVLLLVAASLLPQSIADDERELRGKLDRVRRERPETPGPALDAWERKAFDAEWDYGVALFRLAEHRKDPSLYRQLAAFFTEFIWRHEDDLAALQARLYVARAHEALADWGPCFANLKAARRLETPELRRNPDVIEIATRSLAAELRVRGAAGKGLDLAVKESREHLKTFEPRRESDVFLSLRLEMGRALHALRRLAESEAELREIVRRHAATDPGDAALELLAELFPTPAHVRSLADRLFERHHFTAASIHYGRLDRTPAVWLRLGLSYLHMRRPYEAAFALDMACRADTPERLEAAVRLEQALRHIDGTLGDASVRPRLDAHRSWMVRTLDLERAGPDVIVTQASILATDGKYREAAALYARVPPDQKRFPEALHALDESVASQASIRALERLAAGYEEALRKTGDPKLMGPYARLVVTLSEKTYRPLRDEKLLAAADYLLSDGTAESCGMAFDLYGQYLTGRALREADRLTVEYRRAQAAAGAGRLDRAVEIAADLVRAAPLNGTYQELQADLASARAAALPGGARRNELLDEALRIYGDLSGARGTRTRDEHYYRLLWKYAERLADRDPDQARSFFRLMEKKGYAAWDEGRWGYREKMEALKKRLHAGS